MGKIRECIYEIIPPEIYSVEQYGDCDFVRNIARFVNERDYEACLRRERGRTDYWRQLSRSVVARHSESNDSKMMYIGVMTKNKVAIVLSK